MTDAPDTQLIALAGHGPEDVAILPSGELVTGLADGRVIAIDPNTHAWRVLTCTGGRPLGIESTANNEVIICDTERGLLQLNLDTGALNVLVDRFAGEALGFCNNASVAEDGSIYFSQSSRQYGLATWKRDIVEGTQSGRLFKRQPNGEVQLLADGLAFTNGVTLSADQSSLIYAQSGALSLTRLWLRGHKTGTHEPFVPHLAGFPDNLCTDAQGLIWVALAAPEDARLKVIQQLPKTLRKTLGWAQQFLPLHPQGTVWVQAYNISGQLVRQIHFQHPHFQLVTGMRRAGNTLYLSSLQGQNLLAVSL